MILMMQDKLRQHLHLGSLIFRRAIRTSLAVFIGVVIYRNFSLVQGFWVPLTIVIIMQATTAATLRKGLQRFIGTLVGVTLGSLLALNVHHPYIIDALLVIFLFIAYYMKAFNLINYGVFVIPLSIMIVFLISAIVPQEHAHAIILARLYDTSVGALIGITMTFLVLPNSLKQDIEKGVANVIDQQFQYLKMICHYLLETNDQTQLFAIRNKFEQALSTNRHFYEDWRYELWIKLKREHDDKHFLQVTEKIGQFLFELNYCAIHFPRPLLSQELIGALQNIAKVNSFKDADMLENEIQKLKLINGNHHLRMLMVNLESYSATLRELEACFIK